MHPTKDMRKKSKNVILKKYQKQITVDFLKSFKKNIDTNFEINSTDSLLTYENTYIHLECTIGWWEALKTTCEKYELHDLLSYYNNLNWMKSDAFDLELSHLLITNAIIKQK
ncbi:FlaD/FlaE family flagellar protein [Bacillus cereus group sp. BfR-BA-01328]|uniref:FlaD/FlaE family flagellar protein n=1 Tax=Bacillus cereus group sp. BfR-BA-01328 TaxID=2920304 RepID=UPI001F57F806